MSRAIIDRPLTRHTRLPTAGRRATASVGLGLLTALLLLPSANSHRFDGLPLSSLPEFVVLIVLVPLWTSRALRRLYGRLLHRLGAAPRRAVFAAGILAVSGKLLLLASGTHAGFLACYRSPLTPPPAGPCERAYANPFFRFAVTRVDRELDFAPRTWDLSFFNSIRFNFWVAGAVRRDRLPLTVTWRGTVERAGPWVAQVSYVGQASLRLDGGTLELPAHYEPPVAVEWPVPGGRHELTVAYTFDDGSRIGGASPSGPYATFRVRALRAAGGGTSRVPTLRPAAGWRALGWAIDAGVLALASTVAALHALLLRRERWMLGVVALAGPALGWLEPPGPGAGNLLLLGGLYGRILAAPRGRRLLTAYFALAYLTTLDAARRFGRLSLVEYRSGGGDWLTYESFARSVLESWSLRGGEAVFYYQPLFRYLRFAEHLLLGDGDGLVFAAVRTALMWAVLWMAARLWRSARLTGAGRAVFVGAGLLLLGLASSATMAHFLRAGASETHTWIFLPLAVPLLFVSRVPRHWHLGTLLLGLSFLARTNQAPALAWTCLVFARRAARIRPRAAVSAAGLFAALTLLPLAHNLAFGGRPVLLTTGAGIPENLVLPPARWLDAVSDTTVRAAAWDHLTAVLYANRALLAGAETLLLIPMRGLLLAWGLALAWLLSSPAAGDRTARWLLALPALYLAVHLFYQVAVYYPRHLLVAYLAMGAVVMLAAREAGRRRTAPG